MADFAKILAIFQEWDNLGSGTIGCDDMQTVLVSGSGCLPAEIEGVLAAYNANSSPVLNYADFLIWLFDPDGSRGFAASVLAEAPVAAVACKKPSASVPAKQREEEKEATASVPENEEEDENVAAEEREEEEEAAPTLALNDTKTSKGLEYLGRIETIKAVKEDGLFLRQCSLKLRGDKVVALAAVKQNGVALEHCSEKLRNDKEVAIEAVKRNGRALMYCSTELRNDKVVALEAVKRNGEALEYCLEELGDDREIVFEALHHCEKTNVPSIFKLLSKEMQHNQDLVKAALKSCHWLDMKDFFKNLSEELQNQKDLAMEAVKRNGYALQYCSVRLRDDKDIAIEAVKENGNALEFCSETLRNDKNVAMEAVKQKGNALEYCSETLRNDKYVAIEAVKQNGNALQFCSETLRNDKDMATESLKTWARAFIFFSKDDQNNKQFVIEAVKKNGLALEYCSETFRNDREVAMESVKQNGQALEYCSQKLRSDKNLVMEAARTSAVALKFALKGFNQDPDCLKAAGMMRESQAATEKRPEKGLFSLKFGLSEGASNLSTVVAEELAKHQGMGKFDIYNPNLYCKKSCDPSFTDLKWPCHGTEPTCILEREKKTTDGDGKPTNESCWRLSFRFQQKLCKESGGFMLQLEENGKLGAGQEIEVVMAKALDLKIFRFEWNACHVTHVFDGKFAEKQDLFERLLTVTLFKSCIANQIADAVLEWFADEKRDSQIKVIPADPIYESKQFGGGGEFWYQKLDENDRLRVSQISKELKG